MNVCKVSLRKGLEGREAQATMRQVVEVREVLKKAGSIAAPTCAYASSSKRRWSALYVMPEMREGGLGGGSSGPCGCRVCDDMSVGSNELTGWHM